MEESFRKNKNKSGRSTDHRDIVYIYLDTKLDFEFIQNLKPFKNEVIGVKT